MLNRFSWSVLFTLLLGCSLTFGLRYAPQLVAETQAEENEKGEKPGADEWFVAQRAYPLKAIPFDARVRAIEQMDAAEARQTAARVRLYGKAANVIAQQNQPRWEALGPQPIANGNTGAVARAASGRATAIALHPNYDGTNNRTIFLGTAQGGVWKTTDNGANWTPITDDQPSLAIGSLAIDPTNADVIYVGTGEGHGSQDSYYGAGLLKTTDGGATWRVIEGPIAAGAPRLPVFRGLAIKHLTIDPRNPQTIYLCTRTASTFGPAGGGALTGFAPGQRGLWKSTDSGETWRNLEVPGANLLYNASQLLIHPNDSNTLFTSVFGHGIYRSKQSGEPGSWELLAGGLPQGVDSQRVEIAAGAALPPSTNPTLYSVIVNGSSMLQGIYRSTDNGETWQTLSNPASITQPWYNIALTADAVTPNLIYLGFVNLYRSVNGGQTWQNQTAGNTTDGGLHVDQHDAVIDPKKPNLFFIANDGGMWRSENANDAATAMRWVNLNATLNTVQFQGVALHPLDPNFLLGGTQDNGTNRFTGNQAWTRVAGGDGGYALIDQTRPNIVWHSFQNNNQSGTTAPSFGPRVSMNAGDTWAERGCRASCTATPGSMNPTDRVGFYSPMNLHTGFTEPNNVVYWGTQRVYRTPDLGVTWTGLGASIDGFGQDLTKGGGRVTAITAHPKLDTASMPPGETVWVGTSDGNIQVTTNAGKLAEATFTNVTKAPLPNRFVTDIATDATNAKRVYATYSGFNAGTPTTPGHVFVTNDFGETWRNVSGDLPDVPVTSIAIDPSRNGTLYIGTDIGVFQTTDEGATWVRLGNGLPRVASFMVRLHEATRSLVVATHGRGMFRLKLPQTTVSVNAASFLRDALPIEGIAAAFGNQLATRTETAATLPLPTRLAGTTVTLTDANGATHDAPLFFVSPQQINYLLPPALAPGAFTVTITSADGTTAFGIERARNTAPAVFTFNGTGLGVPAGFAIRVRESEQTFVSIAALEGTQYVPAAIDLGDANDQVVLVLYGTGWRRRAALNDLRVTMGGVEATTAYAGEAPGFAGLDQLNCVIPRALIGRGATEVIVRVATATANLVTVRIK